VDLDLNVNLSSTIYVDAFGRRFDSGLSGGVASHFGTAVIDTALPARCRQDVDDHGRDQVQVNDKVNVF
jgi:hypothetical protein